MPESADKIAEQAPGRRKRGVVTLAIILSCLGLTFIAAASTQSVWLQPVVRMIPDRYLFRIDEEIGSNLLDFKYRRSEFAPLPTASAGDSAAAAQLLAQATPLSTASPTATATVGSTATPSPTPILPPTLTPTVTPALTTFPGSQPQEDSRPADLSKATVLLTGFEQQIQTWNNCGPATLVTTMSYWDVDVTQQDAQTAIKSDPEDRNVRPDELAAYAESKGLKALVRVNGSIELLKTLIRSGFPVIVEKGFLPAGQRWQGHYLSLVGYREDNQSFIVMDSYLGANREVTFASTDTYWRHFNRLYLLVYPADREAEVAAIVGPDMDATTNYTNAYNTASAELKANPRDEFGWFNLGTNLVALGRYEDAAVAYDQARSFGTLPFRMLWYQFGMYEAYLKAGRPSDVLVLTEATLSQGVEWLEESYYYEGLAYLAKGDKVSAKKEFELALHYNSHYTAAQQELDALGK